MPEGAFPPPDRSGAIVLVHGAWVGEYSWEPVLAELRALGRAAHAVSLTGHGDLAHLSSPHITLDDHVADVVRLVLTRDLTEITLVGHSYGGRVISKAYDQLADRIARVVYLDAHAPVGEPPLPPATTDPMLAFDAAFQPDPAEFGGDAAVARFLKRAVDHSVATLRAPFFVELPDALPKTYVHATGHTDTRFEPYATAAAAHPAWDLRRIDASHWLIVSHAAEVARILCEPIPEPD